MKQDSAISDHFDKLKTEINHLGIDIFGIVDLSTRMDIPSGLSSLSNFLFKQYCRAIVLGAQLYKLGKKATGSEVSLFLEKSAISILSFLEAQGYPGLIIHTEDEFDPSQRMGLLSLKALAKEAGLGWQGQSLLIINPEFGPIHRLVAILTNMTLPTNTCLKNQCGECSECIDKCPTKALTFIHFDDHPERREDVLDINVCDGDNGCMICLTQCPFFLKRK